MTAATGWSVMKWLREKKRVRKTADQANAALDQLDRDTKRRWPEDLRAAYGVLAEAAPTNGHKKTARQEADSKALVTAGHMKQADDQHLRAPMEPAKTFDDAEKQLSPSLAREGCRKA